MNEGPPNPSYLKAAFANGLNVGALAMVAAASATVGSAWLVGAGLVLEAAWLAVVPNLPYFRRNVDAHHFEARRAHRTRQLHEDAASLPGEKRARVQQLLTKVASIRAEVERNQRISGDFLRDQLAQLDLVMGEYVQLSLTSFRVQGYLAKADVRSIAREREGQETLAQTAVDEAARSLARQNSEILGKRLLIFDELARFLQRTKGQLSLVENTVWLLRDQVMTMATPEAVTLQLGGLVTTVEAMRQAAREVEAMAGGGSLAVAMAVEGAGGPASASEATGRGLRAPASTPEQARDGN